MIKKFLIATFLFILAACDNPNQLKEASSFFTPSKDLLLADYIAAADSMAVFSCESEPSFASHLKKDFDEFTEAMAFKEKQECRGICWDKQWVSYYVELYRNGTPIDTTRIYATYSRQGYNKNGYNYYFAVYYNNLQQSQSYLAQYGAGDSSQVDFDKAFAKQTTEDEDGKKITWAKKAEDEVLHNIKDVYGYYYAAVKANKGKEPEITEDQKKELQETLDGYKKSAKEYGFTLSAYLMAAMGDGVDADTFTHEATVSYIADNYKQDYQKDLTNKEYTEKELNDYLEKNRDSLVSVDVKFFEASNADDAKAFVKALNDDGSNFAELAVKYAEDDDKATYKDELETTYYNATRSTFSNLGAALATPTDEKDDTDNEETKNETPGLDWVFSKDRKAGDKKVYSTSVVYILKPVNLSDAKTVSVRHILIQPEKKDENGETSTVNLSEADKDQKKAAKEKADSVLKEYNDGTKSEDAFAALAKKYSSDSNASDGGLYENVVPNQMVSSFNAWCFDSKRKAGDVAIVETEYGYHVMYFVSKNDKLVWQYTAQTALASESSTTKFDEIEKKVKVKKAYPGAFYFEIDTDIDR